MGWVVFYSGSCYVAQAGFEVIKQEPRLENLQFLSESYTTTKQIVNCLKIIQKILNLIVNKENTILVIGGSVFTYNTATY